MSRSAKIRSVVGRVAAAAQVRIDADYEQRGAVGEWHLRWRDGPTVDTMKTLVKKHARGYVTPEVVGGLRYRREVTARALAAALVQRILDGEQPDAYDAAGIAAATPFPDGIVPRAWERGDFALAHAGVDPRSTWDYDARPALDYLAKAGRDALEIDFWLATETGQPERTPEPPVLDLDTPGARAAVANLYGVLQHQLLGRSAHAEDHRARQLTAQAIRHAVPAMLADCQRADAAAAVVDGWGLRSLGLAIGLGDRTLNSSLGSLDEQVKTLTWLREYADEWTAACRAVGQIVHRTAPYTMPADYKRDTDTLRNAGGGHRALLDTVPAARRLLDERRLRDTTTQEPLDVLSTLLAALDRTEPPNSRERHSRKGIPSPTSAEI